MGNTKDFTIMVPVKVTYTWGTVRAKVAIAVDGTIAVSYTHLLRTHIQRCSNAHFVFSGSHRHLIGAMFTSPARPFYQSVTLINLPPISVDKYAEFCLTHFERVSKHLDTLVDVYKRQTHSREQGFS